MASRGIWNGWRLIGDSPPARGHADGNSSLMDGWSDTMLAWGQVTASGISIKGLNEMVISPAKDDVTNNRRLRDTDSQDKTLDQE